MTTKSIGERALEVALKELWAGIKEEPPGSNTGPKIREYLDPCVRGDKHTDLRLTASNWCMAFSSWCQFQVLALDEIPAHGYRAGVVEAVADARSGKFSGKWVPIQEVRKNVWKPSSGDLAIWDRSVPNRPDTAWWRHVNRVVKFADDEGFFTTVGGNEYDKVRLSSSHITASKLLGFIAYPKLEVSAPEPPPPSNELTEREKEELGKLVALTIDGMLRDSIWG